MGRGDIARRLILNDDLNKEWVPERLPKRVIGLPGAAVYAWLGRGREYNPDDQVCSTARWVEGLLLRRAHLWTCDQFHAVTLIPIAGSAVHHLPALIQHLSRRDQCAIWDSQILLKSQVVRAGWGRAWIRRFNCGRDGKGRAGRYSRWRPVKCRLDGPERYSTTCAQEKEHQRQIDPDQPSPNFSKTQKLNPFHGSRIALMSRLPISGSDPRLVVGLPKRHQQIESAPFPQLTFHPNPASMALGD